MLVSLTALAGCTTDPPLGSGESDPMDDVSDAGWGLQRKPVGIHYEVLPLESGKAARCTLSIPSEHGLGGDPRPLVVALHFGGEVKPFYGHAMIDLLALPGLYDLGAVIVAPDSLGGRWDTAENEFWVMELIAEVRRAYDINGERIVLVGFSMGAAGCWHLGYRHQDVFSAVIPIAGRPTRDLDWKIPLFVIHSRADDVVPIGPTEQHVERLRSNGVKVEFLAVDALTHYETPAFADPLRLTVPWLQDVWQE